MSQGKNISIRPEERSDFSSVRDVITKAFAACKFGHNGEAELVELLRRECCEMLFLVALVGDDVVGQILFSPARIVTDQGELSGMGLAPMAVVPEHQRAGVGTALVEAGLSQLKSIGCPFVVVLGHEEYYPKFGFEPAGKYGIEHGFDGIPQEVFFIKVFGEATIPQLTDGRAFYRAEFGPQFVEKSQS